MFIVRIGSTIAVITALAVAGCGPKGDVARVAAPTEAPATVSGPGAPTKKARIRVAAEPPKPQPSDVP